MKRLISAFALILLLTAPAFSLTDSEYLRMKKSSADFARADKKLSQVWTRLKKSLPKNVFAELQKSQRQWIQSGRDDEAASLMDDGYSRMEAYTMVTNDRADALPGIADSIRDDLRRKRNTSQTRTTPAKNTQVTPQRRASRSEPEPEYDEPDEPDEPGAPINSRPQEIEGEYQNDSGFISVKIIDASTDEAEITASRFKDEVHWTARGWIEDNVLELYDNNYSSCQATLTFTDGKLTVDITDTDDWNEAIAPDFVLKGTYRKLAN